MLKNMYKKLLEKLLSKKVSKIKMLILSISIKP